MPKIARFSLALLLLTASATFAPPVKADYCERTFIYYYDCALNEIGSRVIRCDGSVNSYGQQSGAFKEIETEPCTCGDYTDNWYQWNGSTWVLLSGPPSPTC
jgi:hypothetical protein